MTDTNWTAEIVNNLSTLNDILGNSNGGHVSLTDGGVLLGNAQGAIVAMAVLAKGSLIVGDGTTDPQPLAVGTDGHYLTADSAQSLGMKWAAATTLLDFEDIMLYG